MPLALDLLVSLAAFAGHFAIAVWLFNRLHAFAIPRPAIKALEKILLAVAALVSLGFALRWLLTGHGLFTPAALPRLPDHTIWLSYAVVCWTALAASLPLWLVPKLTETTPAAVLSNDSRTIDVAERLGFRPVHGAEAKFFAAIPGNELLRLAVQKKSLRVERLPPELDGLTIAHLSDLHMTGQIGREFYDVVVEETNALEPDLILITGDILEKEKCLPWVPETLGRLKARCGKFFILGNHEKRLTHPEVLREALGHCGFVDLGSRCESVLFHGANVLLAGTELPWFGVAPDVASFADNPQFRILLSHTPDQLPWARRRQFDLMLAGHNHGGQIRLPYLGALISPSHFGWRYAGGVYHEPPTLLHVSRGIGGIHPIRLNCPPELPLLVLRSA